MIFGSITFFGLIHRQFWYWILSLLEKRSLVIFTSSDFAELPFWALSIPYQIILISDSESPWKMVSHGIHIILFGWITFFGLIHTILGNSNIRFWISSTNCFYWYILCCITFLALSQFCYKILNLLINCFLVPCRPSSNPVNTSSFGRYNIKMQKVPNFQTI